MNIIAEKNGIIIEGIKHFNLVHTFECGQCFRWEREQDGSYTGVVGEKVINIRQVEPKTFEIHNITVQQWQETWLRYFDIERDYDAIKNALSSDPTLANAVAFGWGIRILQQDLWECIISFIISSNNIIPRIKKIIGDIAKEYGNKLIYNGKVYYSFPKAKDLYGKTVEDLSFCKSGYRCKYILDAAKAVCQNDVDISVLPSLSTQEARAQLMKIKGIGPKVADCILLFALQKHDVFPADVWIKRVVEKWYLGKESSLNQIKHFSDTHYGDLAGFAQQYLFYYAREHKIKE